MKRHAWWRHATILILLLLAALYALPSAYPSIPSLDIRPRSGENLDNIPVLVGRLLDEAGLSPTDLVDHGNHTTALFASTEGQLAAQAVLNEQLGPTAVVALNTSNSAPAWLRGIGAKSVALGLDLRGGVHFLLQVDLDFAVARFLENSTNTLRENLDELDIEATIAVEGIDGLRINLAHPSQAGAAVESLNLSEPRLSYVASDGVITASLNPFGQGQLEEQALRQNLETLRRRVDELGVAEPIIAQQGSDRIVVQLPGLQDTSRAKSVLGRRAALELRGVDERASNSPATVRRAQEGNSPAGLELIPYSDRQGGIFVERKIVLSGENIVDANYGSDEAGRPAVHLALDGVGAQKIKAYTRDRIGEQLAIVLVEQDRAEIISAPSIEAELHARFLIHGGGMDLEEANELALLLRSGSLATPIEIIEERVIGPSLGEENIRSGLGAVTGGFILVAAGIIAYYGVFGAISVGALLANLLCLTALLAIIGANLTLPGLAGFALTLGMAIDANVLINERIREELASGQSPGMAIESGFGRAFLTILDANITTLIAGLALFALGSGPIRGFAVVLCLGIGTSMFTAVVVARSFADFVYNRRGRLKKISIG